MKTIKTRLKTNIKKRFSLLLSFVMTFAILMANGCVKKPAVIEDYPEVQVIVEDETEDVDVPEVIEDEEIVVDKDTVNRGYDSIYETGSFVFNPEAISIQYTEEMKNKEASYKAAKIILKALDECKEQIELEEEDGIDDMDFNRGLKLARINSPMASCVDITMVEPNVYKISYFPTLSEDHRELYESDTDIAEVERKYTAFKEYVTDAINNNITADDDYMERAAKIYKFMIENIELEQDNEFLETAALTNPMTLILASYDTDIIDVPETQKLDYGHFLLLYDYFLTQLNVEHVIDVGGGREYDVPTDSIKEAMDTINGNWLWIVVTDEEQYSYHCDILMDKMLLDEQRKSKSDYESDMVFFGMSDDTRNKSIKMLGSYIALTMNSNLNNNGGSTIKCEKDYKYNK
jgi:stress response protein YsnF